MIWPWKEYDANLGRPDHAVAEKMVDEAKAMRPQDFGACGVEAPPVDPRDARIAALEDAFSDLMRKHVKLEVSVFESHRKAENAKNLSEQTKGDVALLMEFYDKEIENVPPTPAFRRVVQRGSVKSGPERTE